MDLQVVAIGIYAAFHLMLATPGLQLPVLGGTLTHPNIASGSVGVSAVFVLPIFHFQYFQELWRQGASASLPEDQI